MPSSIKEIENTTFESVRGTPFTKIHGRPSRNDYELLKKEASDLACELDDITYIWSRCLPAKNTDSSLRSLAKMSTTI